MNLNTLVLYADDTSLVADSPYKKNLITAPKSSQHAAILIINSDETVRIDFLREKSVDKPLHIRVNNFLVLPLEPTNFLGIYVDRILNWKTH